MMILNSTASHPTLRFAVLALRSVLLLFLLATLAGCSQTYNWNQRIKVVIATPDGEVTAQTVQSVEMIFYPEWMRITGFALDYSQQGEAVVADLGEGRYLFVLLTSPSLAKGILPSLGHTSRLPEAFRILEDLEGTGFYDLQLARWVPRMVTFGDVEDPATIQVLDRHNLSAILGSGYELVSLEIEITSDPLTLGRVEEILPWLEARGRQYATVKGKPLSGIPADQPDAINYTVSPSNFSTELYK